jgi:hypothetical protein
LAEDTAKSKAFKFSKTTIFFSAIALRETIILFLKACLPVGRDEVCGPIPPLGNWIVRIYLGDLCAWKLFLNLPELFENTWHNIEDANLWMADLCMDQNVTVRA